jgi:hypothetical protein
MIRTHFGQHDDDCFGCKLATIQFSNVEPPPERTMEIRFTRDMDAYKRLRRQGYQPRMTKNCAEVEARAKTKFEVENLVYLDRSENTIREQERRLEDLQQGMNASQAVPWDLNDARESAQQVWAEKARRKKAAEAEKEATG